MQLNINGKIAAIVAASLVACAGLGLAVSEATSSPAPQHQALLLPARNTPNEAPKVKIQIQQNNNTNPPPATPAAPAAPAAPAGLRDVGTGVDGEQVYANSVTSDAFAMNVEAAYVNGGYWYDEGTSTFEATSPVTGLTYTMTSSSVSDPVIVTGGNNALVEFSL
jgi:hypothetical protein